MIGSVDLSPAHRAIVERILKEHVQQCEVRAFGSRVAWTAKDFSDLDLAVVGKGPLPWQTLSRLMEAFEESPLPMRVDVLDWHAISQSFREVIERGYVVVQEQAKVEAAGEWREVTLGEVITLQRGFDLPKSKRLPGIYPVIASTGPVGTHHTAAVQGPGVVIGRSGSLGGGQFIKSDFWPLNTTLWVKDFQGSDRRFCYYLLKSLDLAQFNAGSGVPTLNRNHIHPIPVKVPSASTQHLIAHILGTLDDKIELNRRMNETLEEMARSLFKSWFVDFDPVRAKAALKQHALYVSEPEHPHPSPPPSRGREWRRFLHEGGLQAGAAHMTMSDHSPLAGEPGGDGDAPSAFRYHSPLEGESARRGALAPSSRWGGTQHGYSTWEEIQRSYSKKTLEQAKALRQRQTDAEGLLWHYLRKKQLGGYKFRRQQPIGTYIVDFACMSEKLLVELEGGQHAERAAQDERRDAFLRSKGFRVLRFWNNEVFENCFGVLERVYEALPTPHRGSPSLPARLPRLPLKGGVMGPTLLIPLPLP